jgi:hypothetical protein
MINLCTWWVRRDANILFLKDHPTGKSIIKNNTCKLNLDKKIGSYKHYLCNGARKNNTAPC